MPRSGRLCKTRERSSFILQPNIRTFILQKLNNFEPGALLINSLRVMQTGSLSFIQHIDVQGGFAKNVMKMAENG